MDGEIITDSCIQADDLIHDGDETEIEEGEEEDDKPVIQLVCYILVSRYTNVYTS